MQNYDPPYVRNAPLLNIGKDSEQKDVVIIAGSGEVLDLQGSAGQVVLTWNFHDPLVDALKALLADVRASAVVDVRIAEAMRQADKVLGAIGAAEKETF